MERDTLKRCLQALASRPEAVELDWRSSVGADEVTVYCDGCDVSKIVGRGVELSTQSCGLVACCSRRIGLRFRKCARHRTARVKTARCRTRNRSNCSGTFAGLPFGET